MPDAVPGPAAHPALAGVDVSSFQGQPGQWVKSAGRFDWAAVKLTELEPSGTRYVNPDASADWYWLKEHDKGRVAYFFGHPSVSVTDSVDFFLTELTTLRFDEADAVALDLEVTDGLGAAEVAAWGVDALSQLEKGLERSPLLYTYIDFATSGNCAGQGGFPLWIADPSSPAGQPTVPLPWHSWAIHQYELSGSIDRDVADYASIEAMSKALGKTAKPKEPDMKNLGCDLISAVASARWPDGQVVVAGLAKNGFIQVARWDNTSWSAWKTVSPGKSAVAPELLVWPDGQGRLYYINAAGNVLELATKDHGQTWT